MPDTAIDLNFADGTYNFWLGLPQVMEIERKCGRSIFEIYDSLAAGIGLDGDIPVYMGGGTAKINEIIEVHRQGLIGGYGGVVNGEEVEVGPVRAKQLIEAYCYPAAPMISGMHVAWAVLHAAITGIKFEKKKDDLTKETNP